MPDSEQQRAAYAWQVVSGRSIKDYENLVKGAPALIMTNGLMQSLAFFESKGRNKEHFAQLNRHICHWLGERFEGKDHFPKRGAQRDFESIMKALHESEPLVYRQATEEVMALLKWIRQFASAVSTA